MADIIDDFLSDNEFEKIREKFEGFRSGDVRILFEENPIDWHYNPYVSNVGGHENDVDFYMTHMIFKYPHGACSKIFNDLRPIIERLAPTSIISIKENLYPNQGTLKEHKPHTDLKYSHHGGIFSINTCDGYTLLEDGTKVSSVANRMLLFDASKPHASTTTSNTKARMNINFNYHKFSK